MTALPHIPGYEVISPLGGGQMTAVYSARAVGNSAAVAVKILRPEWQDVATAVQLLQREARACLAVRHPRLVQLRQAQVTRPPYFLVTDLLDGESLRQRLRRDGRLEAAIAVRIARQIAQALVALHRRGFIHGDVKPDNVRLAQVRDERDERVTLLDLGFAHRAGENTALLRQGCVLGTVDYLAPELCGAEPADDVAADVFSLGVTLFEMLSGQLPYPPGSVLQTMRRHAADLPDDLRAHGVSLPSGLAEFVQCLLARHPTGRPRMDQVVRKLIAFEHGARRLRRAA